MASLLRSLSSVKVNKARRLAPVVLSAVRNHWNYQFQPGPYPRTAEERAVAAKRYGLTVEEYQPYPEEAGYGDYPKLPEIGADSKDATYPYDNTALKRNWNEPMHAQSEMFGEDRYDPAQRHIIPLWKQWTMFLGTIGGSYLLYAFLDRHKMGRPVTIKQYAYDGKEHYEFSS